MLSDVGGRIHNCVWEAAAGTLINLMPDEQVSEREFGLSWISEEEIMNVVVSAKRPHARLDSPNKDSSESFDAAVRSSVMVFNSGVGHDNAAGWTGGLEVRNVVSGGSRIVAGGTMVNPMVAPDGKYVVAMKKMTNIVSLKCDPGSGGGQNAENFQLTIVDIKSGSTWTPSQSRFCWDPFPHTMWSSGTGELYLAGLPTGECSLSARSHQHLLAMRSVDHTIRDLTGSAFDLPPEDVESGRVANVLPGDVLFKGRRSGTQDRMDWWVLESKGEYINVTEGLPAAPNGFVPDVASKSFLTLSDGNLWRIELERHVASVVSRPTWPSFEEILSENGSPTASRKLDSSFLLLSRDGAKNAYYRLSPGLDRLIQVQIPPTDARIAGYAAKTNAFLFQTHSEGVSSLWIEPQEAKVQEPLIELNKFMKDVASPECRRITYRGRDGSILEGVVRLPFGYEEGNSYPLIVRQYPGTTLSGDALACSAASKPSSFFSGTDGEEVLLELLTGHGYAVLIPSVPLTPTPDEGHQVSSDPYTEIVPSIDAAVDSAIDVGIADAKRLGIFGESYGGFGVLATITQTGRFKVAVAQAAPVDWTSLYGVFVLPNRFADNDSEDRYKDAVLDELASHMCFFERNQPRMGAPPWRDPARYSRNSPITNVAQVETPVLLIQGDIDWVKVEQGQEFFSALYRQGKRSQFVVYVGEGHSIARPANFRDMWERTFAWFDEFLSPTNSRN
jgi:dienelactone hydrolase